MDELDERIGQAYAARTFADLQAVTHDLPGPGVTPPAPAVRRASSPAVTRRHAATTWLSPRRRQP